VSGSCAAAGSGNNVAAASTTVSRMIHCILFDSSMPEVSLFRDRAARFASARRVISKGIRTLIRGTTDCRPGVVRNPSGL
jgi:hypothetical protein